MDERSAALKSLAGSGISGALPVIIEYGERVPDRAEMRHAMDLRRGAANRQKRDWLQREARAASMGDRIAPPLRQFFVTVPVGCPYLPGRAERKLIMELGGSGAALAYDDLSRAGFRRSHRFAYRPACRGCASCIPVRIAVDRFHHSRSSRRIRNTNRDLSGRLLAARATPEQFQLFSAYQRSRHRDSDMASMTYGDYRGMIEDTPVRTAIAEFRDGGGLLVAASLIDLLDDGVSAVYSFYDPDQPKRSLGSWSVLWLVEECRQHGQPYVYLGYWIADSPKMAYKARFPALESLVAGSWTEFAHPEDPVR
jgi:leucyl-tRNA---protein transferase